MKRKHKFIQLKRITGIGALNYSCLKPRKCDATLMSRSRGGCITRYTRQPVCLYVRAQLTGELSTSRVTGRAILRSKG